MLTDKQCSIINRHLAENVEPRKVAAYLCLNMGLLLGEVTALRRQDIDIDAGVLHIRNVAGRGEGGTASDPGGAYPIGRAARFAHAAER